MRRSLWAAPGYLLATLVFLGPLVAVFGHSLPAVYAAYEPLHQAFFLGWDLEALSARPLEAFRAPIFHPAPRALTTMDHLLGEAIVAWPVFRWTGNLAAAYNAVLALSFVASAWAVYRLARLVSLSRPASFVCGLLFAFSPYRWCNLGELNQLQTQFLPLGVFFALRFARRRRTRDLAGLAATLVAQFWFGWYGVFHLAVALGVVAVDALVRRPQWRDVPVVRMALAAVVVVALVLPVTLPYLRERSDDPGARRTLGQASLYSADVLDYLRVNRENRLLTAAGVPAGDQGYFPGLVTVVLAIAGLSVRRFRSNPAELRSPAESSFREARLFGFLALTGAVLSLGPLLKVAGRALPIPLPYAALHFLPGFSGMRAPGRFAVVALLGLVILAGIGYERWRHRSTHAGRRGWFGIALAAIVMTSWSAPFPLVPLPDRASMSPVYRWLAEQTGRFAILELPMAASEQDEGVREALRMVAVLHHGKPILDGLASRVPPHTRRLRRAMQSFPDSSSLAQAAGQGARVIVVHYAEVAPGARDRLRSAAASAPGLRVAADFGDDVAYEIVSAPRR